MVPTSDRTSVPVERHASADLVSMITIAQGQAGRSARLSDVNSSTSQVSRQAGGRAANEQGGHRYINSDASPASLAAGGYGGPCRTSRKPRHVSSIFGYRRDAAICTAAAGRPALRFGDFEWPHLANEEMHNLSGKKTYSIPDFHTLCIFPRCRKNLQV